MKPSKLPYNINYLLFLLIAVAVLYTVEGQSLLADYFFPNTVRGKAKLFGSWAGGLIFGFGLVTVTIWSKKFNEDLRAFIIVVCFLFGAVLMISFSGALKMAIEGVYNEVFYLKVMTGVFLDLMVVFLALSFDLKMNEVVVQDFEAQLKEIEAYRKQTEEELQALKIEALQEVSEKGGYYWKGQKYTSERSFYNAKKNG